jgi:hypothetical protein
VAVTSWRWWRRRPVQQRAQLAADARNLAGFAAAAVQTARRLGAEVPDGVAACPLVWSHWADRLEAWARRHNQGT